MAESETAGLIGRTRTAAVPPAQLGRARRKRASWPARTSPRRVLVVVDDDTCAVPGLCSACAAGSDEAVEALVLAPARRSAATQWYVDDDAARADATHRLRKCAACLTRAGVHADVRLTEHDPVQAIAEALHGFRADEILLVTGPQRPSAWLHPREIERARRRFRQPIEDIVVPPSSIGNG